MITLLTMTKYGTGYISAHQGRKDILTLAPGSVKAVHKHRKPIALITEQL